jgi:hypothetical protein
MDNLEDVLLCNAKPLGHVRDLHKLVVCQGAIDQDADCVAGLLRQAHICLPGGRAAAALESDDRFFQIPDSMASTARRCAADNVPM